MDHLKNIKGYDSLEALAKDIGDLHYESFTELLFQLAKKIQHDSEKDRKYGRQQLADALSDASGALYGAYDAMDVAWKICKKYMK